MKDKVKAAYAKLAVDYEKHVDESSGYNAYYERPAMMQLLPENLHGVTALDAGCAAGWYAEQLARRGAEVTAVDLSPEMVEATRRRLGLRGAVRVHDLTDRLPFPDASFHLVLSSLTLHYIDDWGPTFAEFSRVMKPGAQLVFSVHHPFMDFTSFDRPNYFAHEVLEETWNKPESGPVEVAFYRRPLTEIIDSVTRQFVLRRLVEPLPTPEFLEKLPQRSSAYDYLQTHPHFLIIAATKTAK